MATWTGSWRNQYGSVVTLNEEGNRLSGTFRTVLHDSGFFGRDYEVVGTCHGDCIAFAFAGATPKGDMVCAFTGVLREGKMQTVWHVVSDKQAWPHAVVTNADTFERIPG